MSRTDKTSPWRVKALFYPNWVVEYHNHENHECNLPPRPTYENITHWGSRSDCGWVYSMEFMTSGMAKCPCPMCHGYWAWMNEDSRARRRRARRYVKDGWKKEY